MNNNQLNLDQSVMISQEISLKAITEKELEQIIRVVLNDVGFDIDQEFKTRDYFSVNFLACASYIGSASLVELLLNNRATVNASNRHGMTVLHWAVANGHYDVIATAGVDLCALNGVGSTALHYACVMGNREIIDLLLDAGVPVDLVNKNNVTPLYVAVEYGHTEIVKLLLEYGADYITNSTLLLDKACEKGWLDIVDILLGNGVSAISLHRAVSCGSIKMVNLLLKYGSDVNEYNYKNETALHYASKGGFLAIVKLLIKHGAEIDKEGNHGFTALHYAVEIGHAKIVQLLIKCGASIQKTVDYVDRVENCEHFDFDLTGATLLHIAAWNFLPNMIKTLLDFGCPIDQQDSTGLTPLHIAAHCGDLKNVQLLLVSGANVNILTGEGCTAFSHAEFGEKLFCYSDRSDQNYSKIMKLLLSYMVYKT